MIKSEWLAGTPLERKLGDPGLAYRTTIDYSQIKLSSNPELLNRAIIREVELLWCLKAEITPIIISEDHIVVKIKHETVEEIAHVFEKNLIDYIRNEVTVPRELQLAIKTRIALADPKVYFNEIRHIERSG